MKTENINEDSFKNDLKLLYKKEADFFVKKWKRNLPLDEMLFDRWEKAKKLNFGENASVYHNSYIYGDVKVGKKTWIGPFTILDGSGKLEIGANCSIASGVQIYTHDTVRWALSGGKEKYEKSSVRIGNCCYIGPLTIIAKGVLIGDHSLIGANSFVNRDVPSFSIAVGSPIKIIGEVKINKKTNKVTFIYHEKKMAK